MIIVYTAPWCLYCKKLKTFLNEKKVDFVERDVSSDIAAQKEVIEKSGQMSLPVIDYDGRVRVCFDKSSLIDLLGL